MLVGRAPECARVYGLLRGEPGVGKTALMRFAAEQARLVREREPRRSSSSKRTSTGSNGSTPN